MELKLYKNQDSNLPLGNMFSLTITLTTRLEHSRFQKVNIKTTLLISNEYGPDHGGGRFRCDLRLSIRTSPKQATKRLSHIPTTNAI